MPPRSAAGRFRADKPRDPRMLLDIVRDVAKAAVADDPTRTPLSVTHDEFKRAALLPEIVGRYGQVTTESGRRLGIGLLIRGRLAEVGVESSHPHPSPEAAAQQRL